MSNSVINTQLARIVAPSLSNGSFSQGMEDVFRNINDNFIKIASLPFIQGVQGDSYKLVEKNVWVSEKSSNGKTQWKLTKAGAILLNSIFAQNNNISFDEDMTFYRCREILKPLNFTLDKKTISPLDSFVGTVDEEEIYFPICDAGGFNEKNTIKNNNNLYFYSIINDAGEEENSYLGQYYYFVDGRLQFLGELYRNTGSEKALNTFFDYTSFYKYIPKTETSEEKYESISILPSLYYDKDKNDICWKFNGNNTGISAIGPKGLNGKDAAFTIVYVDESGIQENAKASSYICGFYDIENHVPNFNMENKIIENSFCLIQFIKDRSGDEYVYGDSAFGEVRKNVVYWDPNLKIGNIVNNKNITEYFCNMGVGSSEEIALPPAYLAIPAFINRSTTTLNEPKYNFGHVFRADTGNTGDLIIQKISNAFDTYGNQGVSGSTSDLANGFNEGSQGVTGNLIISNYNVKIGGSESSNSGQMEITPNSITLPNGSFFNTSGAYIKGAVGITGNVDITGIKTNITSDNFDIKVNQLGIHGGTGLITITGATTNINSNVSINGGLIARGTPQKSNILYGPNNPGNSELSDFGDIDNNGYPLVIKSRNRTGFTFVTGTTYGVYEDTDNCMVFGDADIYALQKTGSTYTAATLYLQDRTDFNGDTVIGGKLFVGKTNNLGLDVKGPVRIAGSVNITGATTNIKGNVGITGSVSITGATTNIKGNVGITGSVSITGTTTKIKSNIFAEGGLTVRGTTQKSNIFYGPNNPGNDEIADFGNVDNNGYPLVIKSRSKKVDSDDSMIFGTADIYAVKKSGSAYVSNDLCLQHRTGMTGAVRIGSKLIVSDVYPGGLEVKDSANILYNLSVGENLTAKREYLTENLKFTTNIGATFPNAHYINVEGGTDSELYINSESIIPNGTVGINTGTVYDYARGKTGSLEDFVNANEGNLICGAKKNLILSDGRNRKYTVYNRASIQSVEQKAASKIQSYTGSTLHINPFGGEVKIGSPVDISGSVNITGATTNIKGNVGITGSVSITGATTNIKGNVGITGSVNITGATTNIKGNVGITGSVNITGATTNITSNVGIKGSVSITGATTNIKGNVGITGSVNITGATTNITSNVGIKGNASLNGNLTITGATANITSNVGIKGNASLNGNLTITGATTNINSNVGIKGNANLTGDLTITGSGKIKGPMNEGYVGWNGTVINSNTIPRTIDKKNIDAGTISPISAAWANVGSNNAFTFLKDSVTTSGGNTYHTNYIQHQYKFNGVLTTTPNPDPEPNGDETLFKLFNTNDANIYLGNPNTETVTVNDNNYIVNKPGVGDFTELTILANSIKKAVTDETDTADFYYGRIKKILFFIAAANCKLVLDISGTDPKGNEVGIIDNYVLAGDSGWNEVPLNIIFGGGKRQGLDSIGNIIDFNRFYSLKFKFRIAGVTNTSNPRWFAVLKGMRVLSDIQWGVGGFSYPSLSKTGHIYTYDQDANTTFPAEVSSKGLNVKTGAEIYSGSGLISDNNILKVNSTSVDIVGNIGELNVSGDVKFGKNLHVNDSLSVKNEIHTDTLTVDDKMIFGNEISADSELVRVVDGTYDSVSGIVGTFWANGGSQVHSASAKASYSNSGYAGVETSVISGFRAKSNELTIKCPVLSYSPKLTIQNNNSTWVNKVEGCDIFCTLFIYLYDDTDKKNTTTLDQHLLVQRVSDADVNPGSSNTYSWDPIYTNAIDTKVSVIEGHSYSLKIKFTVTSYTTNGANTAKLKLTGQSYSVSPKDGTTPCTISENYLTVTEERKTIMFSNGVVTGSKRSSCGGLYTNKNDNKVYLFGTQVKGDQVQYKSIPLNDILNLVSGVNWDTWA